MRQFSHSFLFSAFSIVIVLSEFAHPALAANSSDLEVGIAIREITPNIPIWLAGYAARKQAADKIDHRLLVQAIAFRDGSAETVVMVSLDNCEVNHEFTTPVIQECERRFNLRPGQVMIVSSHTHSAPVLEHTLVTMYSMSSANLERVEKYSRMLQTKLVEVVGAALADLKPALLQHGVGSATFAMNRRVYREDGGIAFGENRDGPVDWDVPVLRISDDAGALRAVLFGYACHGTSISGDDFYVVSGDYMAYARDQIESLYPGVTAIYLTGMGADSNPSPRGTLLDSKRHGAELAGAVIGILNQPMRPVRGSIRFAYREIELPFEGPPNRERLQEDAKSENQYIKRRAEAYLRQLENGDDPPTGIELPLAAVRIGDDLTFVAMGGEVVVDYSIRLKRILGPDNPWLIGYAYEVPCYIPSVRILKEGGYEAESSLIYYGFYGPFRPRIENLLIETVTDLVRAVRD